MMGMNKKQMERAMKQMGIQQQDIEATEVIIRTPEKEIVIQDPSVARVNMMGQDTWQVAGTVVERSLDTKAEINKEDIETVMEQTKVSEAEAKKAIEEADGDLAQAIMNLQ